MKTRAAVAFEAGKPLEIEMLDLEGPKAGEVLVEVKATGVCHTDAFTLSGDDPEGAFPAILGHEGAGVVVEVGAGVTSVSPGDHVIPLYTPECRECDYCLHPKTNLCQAIRSTQGQGVMPDGTSRFSLGGDKLLQDDAINALRERLLPRAYLVTPNHHEASALAEQTINDVDDMHEAAATIHSFGARNVLVKGGDLPGAGEQSVDVLYDGVDYRIYSAPRIASRNTHGTGCTLASAIAAELALGQPLAEAVANAKAYVGRAIAAGRDLGLGAGHGPLQHFPGQR